jgi:predicted HTH transcriptional regulator
MTSKLPINLEDLLHQRKVEGERIEYKTGWNPDPIMRTLCAFANDFENLGGGYVVIGQDCDEMGMPVFPPKGLPVHPRTVSVESTHVGTTETAPVKTSVKTPVETPVETPDQILRMLDEKREMTLAEVASKIGKSLRAVERASSKLVKAGRLRFVGPKKGGHWEVIEKS